MNAIKELNYDQDYRDQLAIDKFCLIEDQYATHSVYILLDQDAQSAMDNLIRARETLKDKAGLDQKTESTARLQLKKSYHKLAAYQLNLSPADISRYDIRMSFFNKLDEHIYYVPHEDMDKAYKPETGFILEPTEAGSVLSL